MHGKKLHSSPFILWAVNPVASSGGSDRRLCQLLFFWARDHHARVEPVHVFSIDPFRLFTGQSDKSDGSRLHSERNLIRWLEKLNFAGLLDPRFLDVPGARAAEKAHALLSYATSAQATFIAAILPVGNFLSALLNASPIPIMLVGERRKKMGPTRCFDIVFEKSQNVRDLYVLLEYAKTLGNRLQIHCFGEYSLEDRKKLRQSLKPQLPIFHEPSAGRQEVSVFISALPQDHALVLSQTKMLEVKPDLELPIFVVNPSSTARIPRAA